MENLEPDSTTGSDDIPNHNPVCQKPIDDGSTDEKCSGKSENTRTDTRRYIMSDIKKLNDFVCTKLKNHDTIKNEKYAIKIDIYYDKSICEIRWFQFVDNLNNELLKKIKTIAYKKDLNENDVIDKEDINLSRIELYCGDIDINNKQRDVLDLIKNIRSVTGDHNFINTNTGDGKSGLWLDC